MNVYLKNIHGEKIVEAEGNEKVTVTFERTYEIGDVIVITTDHPYVTIELDQYLAPAEVYLPTGRLEYAIPFGEKRKAYHPEAFLQEKHELKVTVTSKLRLAQKRNIAMNPLDKRDYAKCFPHSDANVMTRDESVFESRNAIDGVKDNQGHGDYPYQSWGGGLRDDLTYTLDFGREVLVDELALTLRADYENDHDIHWHDAIVIFSDQSAMPISMIKTTDTQSFKFEQKKIQWLKLTNLKREMSSAYSALSQLEVIGKDLL